MDKRYSGTVSHLKQIHSTIPEIGIVLGTGLGGLVREIEIEKEIPYSEIPNFPLSTVESHSGKLIFGKIGKKNIVAMQGRFHFYEGYDMFQITFPIRIMKLLGVKTLYVSNACGAMNLQYKKGDLMIIDDHINLQSGNPLIGPNIPEFGPRFPDMSEPYSKEMIHAAWAIAKEEKIPIHKGVYVAVNGPNLETRAEYKFLRAAGADVVGMSTVPEVIVANQMGMKVFAVSLITDECDPSSLKPVSLSEILEVANAAEPKLTKIFCRMIEEYQGL